MSDDQGPIEPGPGDPDFDHTPPPSPQPPPAGQPPPDHQQPEPNQGYHQPGYEYPPPDHGQQGYPQAGQPQPNHGAPAYGQPGYASYGAPTPAGTANQNANIALGLSIGGLATYVVGLCCAPLGVIGFLLCSVGLFLGYRETRAIDSGIADPAGSGTAKAAQIIGGIGVGLFVVGFLVIGTLFGATALL